MSPRTIQAAALTLAAFVSAAAATGCTHQRGSAFKRDGEPLLGRLGASGEVIEPNRCLIKVWIVPRPLNDPVVNSGVWATADEQSIPSETRRALEMNGVRVGVLTGNLPAELEAALNAPPPNKIEPTEFNLPEGSPTLISLAASTPSASILLNRDGRAQGKDYTDASGWFRLTPQHDGPTGVTIRLVPEIHHGPVLRRFDASTNGAGNFNGMPFTLKDGQEEETLRELVATVRVEPGQTAVFGCLPDRKGSLGSFLFTQAEANSDRLLQKLVLVKVARSNPGIPGSTPPPKSRLEPVEPPDLPGPVESRGGGPDGKEGKPGRPPAEAKATEGAKKDAAPADQAVTPARGGPG